MSVDPAVFQTKFDELTDGLAPLFSRREPRRHAVAYLHELLSDLPRKNGWTMPEYAGQHSVDGMQRLLYRAVWDQDAARDVIRDFAVRHLAAPGAVLVFDETGQEKKGTATAGMGRQYTGTIGQVSNAIVAVYCTFASTLGQCLIDGDCYVREHWAKDPERCEAAGLGRDFTFRTKTAIAREQATRALDAGLDVAWVAGDEVYGRSTALRILFEQRGVGYVFAVGVNHTVATATGTHRADHLATTVPTTVWNRMSCGTGAKGPRYYDWAMLATTSPSITCSSAAPSPPPPTWPSSTPTPPRPGGDTRRPGQDRRDQVGSGRGLPTRKGSSRPRPHQTRLYRFWHRHIALAMAALALLAVIAILDRRHHPVPVLPVRGDEDPPADCGMIALTVPETRRLFLLFTSLLRHLPAPLAAQRMAFHLRWSIRRRRDQARTRWHHYKKRLALAT